MRPAHIGDLDGLAAGSATLKLTGVDMGLPLFYWCPRFSAFLAFPKLLPAFILVLLNVRLWEPLLTAGTFLGLLTTFKMLGEPLLEKPLFALGTRSHPSGRANNFLWQLRTF